MKMDETRNCYCDYCKNNLPFDLPEEVIEAVQTGNLVIFAGAGISTEVKSVFNYTLYDDIKYDLKIDPNNPIDFPNLMSSYCSSVKNGRQQLLQKIKQRFNFCHRFKELYERASRFHQEISSIYSINTIITTNWDDFFERECGATPFVTAEDFAFYNLPERKVFKIHGSISNYGSIVATKGDYDRCYKKLQSGLIGGYLKTLLATKVILFVGYSFRDYDFNRVYSYLKKEMKDVIPHAYIITLDKNFTTNVDNSNITVINTDGTFFFKSLRKHLEGIKFLLPKERLSEVYLAKMKLAEIHSETTILLKKYSVPNVIYATFYQDGLQHAFDYLIHSAQTGVTFCPTKMFNDIDNYQDVIRKKKVKNKHYADVAYIDGYIRGLKTIILGEKNMPYWYIPGYDLIDKHSTFVRLIKQNKVFHKGAQKFGEKYFKDALDPSKDLVLHHTPVI